MIGDLTGVTADGSDRLKQKRAQIQPTLWLAMLRPRFKRGRIPHAAEAIRIRGRLGYRSDLNSHLLNLVRARSAQVIGES